jgi:hypothetical protein
MRAPTKEDKFSFGLRMSLVASVDYRISGPASR